LLGTAGSGRAEQHRQIDRPAVEHGAQVGALRLCNRQPDARLLAPQPLDERGGERMGRRNDPQAHTSPRSVPASD
jgi:hypothetical protein